MPVLTPKKSSLKKVFNFAVPVVVVGSILGVASLGISAGLKNAETERQKEAQREETMSAARARAAERTAIRQQEEAAAQQAAEDALKGRLVDAFNKGQKKFVMPSDNPAAVDFMSIVSATDPATGDVYISAHKVLGLDGDGNATTIDPVPAMKVTLPAAAPK
jgi:hypothetical protein